MNIFARFFQDDEAAVVKLLVDIKTGVVVGVDDIEKGLQWIASNAPAVASQIEAAVAIAEQLGVTSNAEVAAAVTAANAAVTALDAYSAAANSGASTAQALVDGYVAVKQAQAAASSAAAAAAAQPTSK